MLLTDRQQDALTELINIAFARAAASLSELIGERILLEVPQVSIHPVSNLPTHLQSFSPSEVVTINQLFKGSMSGNALLLLSYDSALMLMNLLNEKQGLKITHLDISAYEMLTEVGNILLNACMGIFGNLLQIPVLFSVPLLRLDKLDTLINSLILAKNELRYALVVSTSMRVNDNSVTGYLMLVSGVPSLYALVRAIENWAEIAVTADQFNVE